MKFEVAPEGQLQHARTSAERLNLVDLATSPGWDHESTHFHPLSCNASNAMLDGFVIADGSRDTVKWRSSSDAQLKAACINAIPGDHYKEFVQAGYEIKVVNNIADYDRQMKTSYANVAPPGYPAGWTWKNVDMFFDSNYNKIVICKNFIPFGSSTPVPTEAVVDVPRRFRHEFGHALDELRGFPMQQSKKLQELYAAAVFALKSSPVTAKALNYYLQAGGAGLRETIAALYSVEHGGGTDQLHVENSLQSVFGPMLKYMKEHKF